MGSSLKQSRSKATIKTQLLHKNQYFYLLTIAKHQVKDYVNKSQLDKIVNSIKYKHDSLHVINYCYEISPKYNQLHFHGIVRLNHKISYKLNCSLGGFRLQWKPIYNWVGANQYITKEASDIYKQEQILEENFYHHHYAFRDEDPELEVSSIP